VKIAGIIGGGAWGTALAQVCAKAGLQVILWAREDDVVASVNAAHENTLFLPGIRLDAHIRATAEVADLGRAELVFAAPPAQHFRAALASFSRTIVAGVPVLACAKGVEATSLKLMTEIIAETLPEVTPGVLSGPSFAEEVALGLPTAVTLAMDHESLALEIAQAIASPTFRPYVTTDMIGAQAGGAIKNVLAIACGVAEGRQMGASARAALITRGFAELTRLAVALGGAAETAAGLCGLGDLVLTCGSAQSRNMRLGQALGRGQSLAYALAGKVSVAEGVASAPAVTALARRLGVEAPICEAVRAILADEIPVDRAITQLLARPLRAET
jgi:glycerol-3-phosphate dehydrogenase (NAD(P)+)